MKKEFRFGDLCKVIIENRTTRRDYFFAVLGITLFVVLALLIPIIVVYATKYLLFLERLI